MILVYTNYKILKIKEVATGETCLGKVNVKYPQCGGAGKKVHFRRGCLMPPSNYLPPWYSARE
jgi:hypothetical protein